MIKNCSIHGITEFSSPRKNSPRCKKCAVDSVQRRRKKVKQKALDYKGGKCSICSYNKCMAALEFHHVNPDTKEFGIASKGYTRGWDKVKAELDKCILICANCHRELHASEA